MRLLAKPLDETQQFANSLRMLKKQAFRDKYGYWPTGKVLEAHSTAFKGSFTTYGDISPRVGINAVAKMMNHSGGWINTIKEDREPSWLLQLKQEKHGLARLYSQELLDDVEEWKRELAQSREAYVCYTPIQFFFLIIRVIYDKVSHSRTATRR